MSDQTPEAATQEIPRQTMQVDIACVGFGPAMCGFLTTLERLMMQEDGTPVAESKAMPGMPPQVICYERADDPGFGVSGVVTKGRAIRNSYLHLDLEQIPMAAPVTEERLVYLLDHIGASRRSGMLKLKEKMLPLAGKLVNYDKELHAAEIPFIPEFMSKEEGMVLSLGQFTQWVATQVMSTGMVQVWPSTPVAGPLLDGKKVLGVRLCDQGVNKNGEPDAGFMPGMDIHADLTVIGDGPVGPVSREIDQKIGMPDKKHVRDWAVGMKVVVDLPEGCDLKPGTVFHTIGFPEPEIFGFLYVYPNNVASMGIFVPSWFDNPVRTAYRYMQHWMMHPYIWRYIEGGTLRSWGAKSLQESGKQGEPFLVGDGYARIGECSGTTNVLTGSGVDEAWATGKHLGESVIELLKKGKPFTQQNLEDTYVKRRRASWVEEEAKQAKHARDGFQSGFLSGMIGMALAGYTKGKLNWPGSVKRPQDRIPTVEDYYRGVIPGDELQAIREECKAKGASLHDALMDRAGWPQIPLDGKLLISHQDALLMGGKVQAPPGYADHVRFADPATCESCYTKVCIEACSGQAISTNPEGGVPLFDREKCVHCGACLWNCSKSHPDDDERTNVLFSAGAGGLHSAEN